MHDEFILLVLFPIVLGSQIPPTVDVAIVGAGLSGKVVCHIRSSKLSRGIAELGAQFMGPTQDRVLDLAQSLGLSTFKTFNEGNTSHGMVAEIDFNAPWNHSRSTEWDIETVQSWLNRVAPHPEAQFLLPDGLQSVFSTEPREQSCLHVAGGAQKQRIVGETQLLATNLAERLGLNSIIFSAYVQTIELKGETYLVSSSNQSILAKHVVVAISPLFAPRIAYQPSLPAARDHLTQCIPAGSVGKVYIRAVRITLDSSHNDGSFGAMMGSIEADGMRRLDRLSETEIIKEITDDSILYFGPKVADVPVAYTPPGVLTADGTSLKAQHGRLHFAGTETASCWTGFMDGAIRFGERAAAEFLKNF
ncbi:flavin monoamine oxidase family protein [Aspergillus alliaceus]|uniref:flavin monoamine oxidase family protein n=1 Tax=Petromyces alliaceus TaxID=209559 RepID=UPI0012A40403|nr:uncharacterized protein BDW43DRAFT_296059 [Aspergillus alliaceus]KAB8239692.1 hypothetical protein BDW43DRAFT_296059 [Aspergillus alliaceus]